MPTKGQCGVVETCGAERPSPTVRVGDVCHQGALARRGDHIRVRLAGARGPAPAGRCTRCGKREGKLAVNGGRGKVAQRSLLFKRNSPRESVGRQYTHHGAATEALQSTKRRPIQGHRDARSLKEEKAPSSRGEDDDGESKNLAGRSRFRGHAGSVSGSCSCREGKASAFAAECGLGV